ncbi:MAG: Na+/H+ antiporter NhaC family protein [Myxococcales bacterium]|nr:Na+/H+ antiporter NhaC family protein [Myxococcales bacterium]MCB9643274.1 Na+/H+ antiporter NhaC family protein [Myxococcales bacterium]
MQPNLAWKRYLFILSITALALFGVYKTPVDKGYLRTHAQIKALQNLHEKHWKKDLNALSSFSGFLGSLAQVTGSRYPGQKRLPFYLECQPAPCAPRLRQELQKLSILPLDPPTLKQAPAKFPPTSRSTSQNASLPTSQATKTSHYPHLQLMLGATGNKAYVEAKMWGTDGKVVKAWSGKASATMVHWSAVLPPLIAIFFVLMTGRVLLSLFISLFVGVLLQVGGNVFTAVGAMAHTYLWQRAIYKEFSINIIIFTFSLIGMVNVCTRSGGVKGLIEKLKRYATTPRSSRMMTAVLGILIFFDDYANSIMVGNTMRPMTDSYRVSREKLAYLIDSTAAPIAGIALLSTWIGYEVGLLGEVARTLELSTSGYSLFLSSLPFRFYCWMMLLFLFIGTALNRDYGPMLKAERRAWEEGKLLRDGATPLIHINMHDAEPPEGTPLRWYNALIPILVVMIAGFVGLLWDGGFFQGNSLRQALSTANNTRVFLIASVIGSVIAITLAVSQRILTLGQSLLAWLSGARAMFFAIGILIFAWSMGALAEDLGSAHYLIAMLQSSLRPEWIPLLVFFMAAIISFATGTSWGTMGILLPTAAPLAYAMGGMPTLILSVGAVLDGSIFGDHCSPLSDTTLFSSAAAACDHVDHVKTQVPYALTVMMVAAFAGYLAVAYGLHIGFSVLLAISSFAGIFLLLGKPTNPPQKNIA